MIDGLRDILVLRTSSISSKPFRGAASGTVGMIFTVPDAFFARGGVQPAGTIVPTELLGSNATERHRSCLAHPAPIIGHKRISGDTCYARDPPLHVGDIRRFTSGRRSLARPAGFEPTAPGLGILCSILLSYGRSPGRTLHKVDTVVAGSGALHPCVLNPSIACTSAARIPGSIAEWPASGTITYSASGQARASSSAVMIGQTRS